MIKTENNVENDILAAKLIINRWLFTKDDDIKSNNQSFRNTYIFSNENINFYFKNINFDEVNNVLTVLSSGDHLFNLIYNGVNDIDTFDINRYTYYYALGFKKTMILKYSYEEFINTYKKLIKGSLKMNDVIIDLLPEMDEDQRIFWQAIIDYIFNMQKCYKVNYNYDLDYSIPLFKLFMINLGRSDFINGNTYLLNKDNYELLRNQLINANITFTEANAINIDNYFDKKFDLIILSNILDYFYYEYENNWDYKKLIKYINKLRKISNDNALLFIHYIFSFCGGRSDYIDPLIDKTNITIGDLRHEKTFIIPPIKKRIYTLNDGMIYTRIKK